MQPNPTEANVAAGLAVMRDGGHDGVVAFGGGSALDCGKVVAFMRGQTRPMWDFEDVGDWWTRADPAGIAPIVAVPTTAGTGSEVGRAGVITNLATHTKKVIFHPRMLPAQVICDPELTVGLPPALTAGTGMDALRALPRGLLRAPPTTRWPRGSRSRACGSARSTCRAPTATATTSRRGRTCCRAAAMGATAFQKGLGAIHALSHPVGALYGTHHGLTNAVFMPYVLDFNRDAIGTRSTGWRPGSASRTASRGFLDFVLRLRRDLGIPHTLGQIGVDDARFDEMAAMAVVDPTAGGNPRADRGRRARPLPARERGAARVRSRADGGRRRRSCG